MPPTCVKDTYRCSRFRFFQSLPRASAARMASATMSGGDLERLVVDRLARGRGAAGDLAEQIAAAVPASPISARVIGKPTSVEKPRTSLDRRAG